MGLNEVEYAFRKLFINWPFSRVLWRCLGLLISPLITNWLLSWLLPLLPEPPWAHSWTLQEAFSRSVKVDFFICAFWLSFPLLLPIGLSFSLEVPLGTAIPLLKHHCCWNTPSLPSGVFGSGSTSVLNMLGSWGGLGNTMASLGLGFLIRNCTYVLKIPTGSMLLCAILV